MTTWWVYNYLFKYCDGWFFSFVFPTEHYTFNYDEKIVERFIRRVLRYKLLSNIVYNIVYYIRSYAMTKYYVKTIGV